MSETAALDAQFAQFRDDFAALREQIARAVVGQQAVVDDALTALCAGGHVLLEGAPGIGKTLLVRTLAASVELDFRRIQFTPDLMPADVVGTYVVMESAGRRKFEFQQGPIFSNVVLIDEINRATPKTQSALLEAMQERGVTVANEMYELPAPFFVMATQSLSEIEGTFPLPATQLDRFFFQLRLDFPSEAEIDQILDRTTEPTVPKVEPVLDGKRILQMSDAVRHVAVAAEVRRWAIRAVLATHPQHDLAAPTARQFVRHGSSPRGAQAMLLAAKVRAILDGRTHVALDDLKHAALPALRHRITLNFEGHAEQIEPDRIVREIIDTTPA